MLELGKIRKSPKLLPLEKYWSQGPNILCAYTRGIGAYLCLWLERLCTDDEDNDARRTEHVMAWALFVLAKNIYLIRIDETLICWI